MATEPLPDVSAVVQSLRRITKGLHEFSKAVDREFGITGPQLWAMRTIEEMGGCSAGDLADRLCVHPSTITGVIQRLEEKRLIDRARKPDDRRAVVLTLTTNGKRLLARAPFPAQGELVRSLHKLGGEDITALRRILAHVVDDMDLGNTEARFFFSDD